jgi:hypothetical protein
MKLFAVIVVFIISFLVLVVDDSPSPAPGLGKESQPGQNSGTDENQKAGTPNAPGKDSPFLIDRQYSAAVGKPDVKDSGGQPRQPPSDGGGWDWMIVFTFCLVVVGGIQAYIYCRQVHYMRAQAGYMRGQARYMRDGLEINRQSAKAAQDSADAAKLGAEAAKISADAALTQAKIMESRERPWMTVIPNNPEDWPVKGEQSFRFRFKWAAKNIGSSPAFLTRLSVEAEASFFPPPDWQPMYPDEGTFSEFIIPPNGMQDNRKTIDLTADEVERYLSGQGTIVFYGIIDYHGPFSGPHRTRFYCYWGGRENVKRLSLVGPPKTVEYT